MHSLPRAKRALVKLSQDLDGHEKPLTVKKQRLHRAELPQLYFTPFNHNYIPINEAISIN